MLAIDTNIVVRLLTGDDPDQARRAEALVASRSVWLLTTVVLEAEWVLRSGYGLDRVAVLDALEAFAGLPTVTLQEPDQVARALEWARGGMDFADALHLAGAARCEGFATFDIRLSKAAKGADTVPVVAP